MQKSQLAQQVIAMARELHNLITQPFTQSWCGNVRQTASEALYAIIVDILASCVGRMLDLSGPSKEHRSYIFVQQRQAAPFL